MSVHTEGPWVIEFAASGRPRFITTRDGRSVVAEVGLGERAQADANLLAAAPDLLAALRGLMLSRDVSWEERKGGHDWPEAVAVAISAIAKAKGKS